MHGKQPTRHARAWRFASRKKTCRGWTQAIGHRPPQVTSLADRRPQSLVSDVGYAVVSKLAGIPGGQFACATKISRAIGEIDKAARLELNKTRVIRVVKRRK